MAREHRLRPMALLVLLFLVQLFMRAKSDQGTTEGIYTERYHGTEEVKEDPATTEEDGTDPGTTDQTERDPGTTEEAGKDLGTTEEAKGDLGTTEEAKGDPGMAEETRGGPGTTEEAGEDPGTTEETERDPVTTEEAEGDSGGSEDVFSEDSWYKVEGLPHVDLEGLVANLSAQISWFKYVGNTTLECAYTALREETLMIAIETLYDCLHSAYQECASQYATQGAACVYTQRVEKPCGTLRLGYSDISLYDNNAYCSWHILVPQGFHVNLTFDQFYLEFSGPTCENDYVMVYDGSNRSGRGYGRLCGRLATFSLYASSRQMLVEAYTDLTLAKYGFRAVFQVMDPGTGLTNEQAARHYGNYGNITLSTSWWTYYERQLEPRYYYMWHVTADVAMTLTLKVNIRLDAGAIFTLHDGVSMYNTVLGRLYHQRKHQAKMTSDGGTTTDTNLTEELPMTSSLSPEVTTYIKHEVITKDQEQVKVESTDPLEEELEWQELEGGSSSHQLFLVLQRPDLADDTDLSATYTTQLKPGLSDLHNDQCLGASEQILQGNSGEVMIGLRDRTRLRDGSPVQCFWHVMAEQEDMYVQLQITSFEFNSPTSADCDHEGLLLVDGNSLLPVNPRYGPYCYRDPRGLFTNYAHGSVNNVTSSGRHLLVIFYSYVDYGRSPWQRGRFKAKLRTSQCKGFFQPCSPQPDMVTDYNRLVTTHTDSRLDVDFYCRKEKCCIIQQLPIYDQPYRQQCLIRFRVEGSMTLATSRFQMEFAVPNKLDTSIISSCERQESLAAQKSGGHKNTCLGTQAFIGYHSNSSWFHGAFTMVISAATCGYYRPEVHTHNTFYPPCLTVESSLSWPGWEVEMVDPWTEEKRYYVYLLDYTDTNCRQFTYCTNISIQLVSGYVGEVWSAVKTWPWRWSTWGNVQPGKTRRQLVRVTTTPRTSDDDYCLNMTQHCTLRLKLFNASEATNTTFNRDAEVKCPEEFEPVGKSCYRWILPGNVKVVPDELMPLHLNLSSADAVMECGHMTTDKHTVHLADIDSGPELDSIRRHIFYTWYREVLSHIPGVKVIHIGTNDAAKPRTYRTSLGQPLLYSKWYVPALLPTYPDRTLNWTDASTTATDTQTTATDTQTTAETVPFISDSIIEKALTQLQPEYNPEFRCTAMIVVGNQLPLSWVKIPCERRISGALALCETRPVLDEKETRKPPSNVTTVIQETSHGMALQLSTVECPAWMNYIGDKCYSLYSVLMTDAIREMKETAVPLHSAKSRCPQIFNKRVDGRPLESKTTGADIGDEMTDDISILLNAWRFTHREEGIRVRNTAANESDYCWSLHADHSSDQYWYNFTLRSQSMCRVTDRVYSFMCEAELVQVTDRCQDHTQFTCNDGTCVTVHARCDSHKDCPDGSDEESCEAACHSQIAGLEELDCYTNCHSDNCTCEETYFQCETGGCIPISKHCDHSSDCPDHSDEKVCSYSPCQTNQLQCQSTQQCVQMSKVCDGRADCEDGTDEHECTTNTTCQPGRAVYHLCGDGESCVHARYLNDLIPDCPGDKITDEAYLINVMNRLQPDVKGVVSLRGEEGEVRCGEMKTQCEPYLPRCYHRMEYSCILDYHPVTDTVIPCRLGQHLQHCQHFKCPSMFKCPGSYCIPIKRVCDGRRDCMDGEDEARCEAFSCPGLYMCKGMTRCIRQHQVCNGVVDCPLHRDDESLCDIVGALCPSDGCVCEGRTIRCVDVGIIKLDDIRMPYTQARALIYRNNRIKTAPKALKHYSFTAHLDLSHNEIITISLGALSSMVSLQRLYLHNNQLESIAQTTFAGLYNLKVLTLHGNRLSHLGERAFKDLQSLPVLDLSQQSLRFLEEGLFHGMNSLRSLNLSHNAITKISNNTFNAEFDGKISTFNKLEWISLQNNPIKDTEHEAFKHLPNHAVLHTDTFKLCCFAQHLRMCYPEADEFSTCDHLLGNPVLQVLVWIIATLGFTGNLCVLYQRLRHERETCPAMLVQHLTLANLFVSLHLLTVASADVNSRGVYISKSEAWRSNTLCKVMAFLHMLGLQMSIYLTTLLVYDRRSALSSDYAYRGLTPKATRGYIIMGWILTIVISAIPILGFSLFGEPGYIRNGVCMLFNVMEGRRSPGWPYFTAIFLIYDLLCLLYIIYGFIKASRGAQQDESDWLMDLPDDVNKEDKDLEMTFRRNEVMIHQRLVPVITSCLLTWLPLTVLAGLALYGMKYSRLTSAVLGVIIVPLNSTLMPYLYTFSGSLRRHRVDHLLLNWEPYAEEEELEDMEGDDLRQSEVYPEPTTTTDGGEVSRAGSASYTTDRTSVSAQASLASSNVTTKATQVV